MPKRAAIAILALVLAGCGRLDELQYSPATTGQQWCEQRPCVTVGSTVVNEPLGSFLVFSLALLWIGVGLYFVASRDGQRSRAWFGTALILGGIGAGLAGISYQAFSYVLKCQGWEYCRLTNGFEVGYSITQAVSVSAMLVAVAYACTSGRARRWFIIYAAVNVAVYLAISAIGVFTPNAVLLSFTVLMLFAVPGLVMVIAIAARQYRRTHEAMPRAILIAAVAQVFVQAAYFGYYAAGITQTLWDDGNGFYFSENDVLHVGMIVWLLYVWRALGPRLRDVPQAVSGQ